MESSVEIAKVEGGKLLVKAEVFACKSQRVPLTDFRDEEMRRKLMDWKTFRIGSDSKRRRTIFLE